MLIDKKTKNLVMDYMPKKDVIEKLVNLFDIFSDSTRLKIISMLLVTTMCVSDIAELVCLNQTTVSHQLKQLKTMGIVTASRQGKVVFYSIANTRVGEMLLYGIEYFGY